MKPARLIPFMFLIAVEARPEGQTAAPTNPPPFRAGAPTWEVEETVDGEILDYDAQRILYFNPSDPNKKFKILHRGTSRVEQFAVPSNMGGIPDCSGYPFRCAGWLTSRGALVLSASGLLITWDGSDLILIGELGYQGRLDRRVIIRNDLIVWGVQRESRIGPIFAYDLRTGVRETVARRAWLTHDLPNERNFDATPAGQISYVEDGRVRQYYNGLTSDVTDSGRFYYPASVGESTIFFREKGTTRTGDVVLSRGSHEEVVISETPLGPIFADHGWIFHAGLFQQSQPPYWTYRIHYGRPDGVTGQSHEFVNFNMITSITLSQSGKALVEFQYFHPSTSKRGVFLVEAHGGATEVAPTQGFKSIEDRVRDYGGTFHYNWGGTLYRLNQDPS